MNTTTDKTLSVASIPKAQEVEKEQNIKDWAQYSQWIKIENALGIEIIKDLNEK